MRSFTNLNKSPYVARYGEKVEHWPDCKDFYDLLTVEGDTWFTFGWNLTAPLSVHGDLHVGLGGAAIIALISDLNRLMKNYTKLYIYISVCSLLFLILSVFVLLLFCFLDLFLWSLSVLTHDDLIGHADYDAFVDLLHDKVGFPLTIVDALSRMVSFSLQSLWRRELLKPPERDSCLGEISTDLSESECQQTCPHLEQHLEEGRLDQYVYFIYPPFISTQTGVEVYEELLSGNYSDVMLEKLVRAYCEGNIGRARQGDLNDLSACNDIAFWPMHPMLERLYQFKLLTGTIVDFAWPDDHTVCYSQTPHPFNCTGHRPYDLQPFRESTLFGELGDTDAWLTNHRIRELVNPNHDLVPYVFDNFDYAHCEQLGYDYEALL